MSYPMWMIGDRVTREKYMEDGTWAREGDKCLKDSPLLHGTVMYLGENKSGMAKYGVCWDEDEYGVRWYFGHGISPERKAN